MPKLSAGLLLFRRSERGLQVFLVHPGGPFWKRKDAGAWSLPKGEHASAEDPLDAARREFEEETGIPPVGTPVPLGQIKQRSGKVVAAWAMEGDCDAESIRSNTFSQEWPPRSGRMQEFPEVDRAGWFSIEEARRKLLPAQTEFLDRLLQVSGPRNP